MEAIETRYRSHTCGQLRKGDVGQTVKLAGWVHSYRDHGGLVFIDLRDRDGLTQLVFNADTCGAATLERARHLRDEWVVAIAGKVEAREPKLVNPKLGTGEIEVHVATLDELSQSPTPPFRPGDHELANEELRLAHRYLDLRRPEMQQTLRTRYRVTKTMRDHLGDLGFMEIETPFLTRSTPEGSRDFLVPSRLVPGSFYALPQSPQLFKQILMVGGCDKYMQIVRCFRDEDPRADRQAEFTQLDVEMSFVDRENVIGAIEGLLRKLWKDILNVEVPSPIPHMSYDEAMSKFGSDRPDLRFGLRLHDITDLAKQTDFGIFKSAEMVKCIVVPTGARLTRKETDGLAEWAKGFGAKGLAVTKVAEAEYAVGPEGMALYSSAEEMQSPVLMDPQDDPFEAVPAPEIETFFGTFKLDTGISKFLAPVAKKLLARVRARPGDLICFAADKPKVVHKVLGELRLKMARDLKLHDSRVPYAWVWITDFPLLDYSEEDKKWVATHHPFTSPLDGDLDKLDSRDPAVLSSLKSKAYDIVLNGSELGGGSIRIHRMDVQSKIFDILGIDAESQRNKFGFLLDALQYGAPPHGGIALGVDRVTMILRDTANIRDVIAFPKTQSGADLMCGAPAPIEEKQLREANIRLSQAANKLEGPKLTEHK